MAARRSHMLSRVSGGGDACGFAVRGTAADGSFVASDADVASAAFGGAILRCSLFAGQGR